MKTCNYISITLIKQNSSGNTKCTIFIIKLISRHFKRWHVLAIDMSASSFSFYCTFLKIFEITVRKNSYLRIFRLHLKDLFNWKLLYFWSKCLLKFQKYFLNINKMGNVHHEYIKGEIKLYWNHLLHVFCYEKNSIKPPKIDAFKLFLYIPVHYFFR